PSVAYARVALARRPLGGSRFEKAVGLAEIRSSGHRWVTSLECRGLSHPSSHHCSATTARSPSRFVFGNPWERACIGASDGICDSRGRAERGASIQRLHSKQDCESHGREGPLGHASRSAYRTLFRIGARSTRSG